MNKLFLQQKGLGLIEILVAVFIIGSSLLAIAVLQKRSLELNHNAYVRTQANIIAYELIDQIRASTTSRVAPLQIPTATAVNNLVSSRLPGGSGSVALVNARVYQIQITWAEANGLDANNAKKDTTTFRYSVSL
ncbi:MAG TPA: type IV pilus modification protein PilV [Cellvibrio sp.]|nr:type IV pilus modification protein PilV [Cellvibrio sp.]